MIDRSTIQTILILFGPFLFSQGLATYRSIRAPATRPPRPLPHTANRALNILFVSAFVCLLSTLPFFSPLNIFSATSSRLQTPTHVLFARLSTLGPLSKSEESLRSVFEAGGLQARLLYLRFGPKVLSSCPFVTDPKSQNADFHYLLYALPELLGPHLLHLAVLGTVTSSIFAGYEAGRWRTTAIIAGLALAAMDLLAVSSYSHADNALATRASDISFFYWKRRLIIRLLICASDATLGYAIWATATLRAFVEAPPPAQQLESATRALEATLGKIKSLGAIRNVVLRDKAFRDKVERYWTLEQEMMTQVFEDRDVVEALNDSLANTDVGAMDREAEKLVNHILGTGVSR